MRLLRIALLTSVLAAGGARAADAVQAPAEAARQAMREAMMKQAAPPAHPPMMPVMKPGEGAPRPQVPPGKARGDAAQQKAMGSGMRDADAVRAEMANRAANGSAMGTMKQTTGDMMNAPMMQRSQGMDPGGGMMPGGTGGGGTGMGPGGMGPGGTTGGGMGGGMGGMGATPAPGAATTQPSSGSR
jgi:hypothetical protein